MNLPDADFLAATESEAVSIDDFFDSDASGNILTNVTILAGEVNTLKITLEPMVKDENRQNFKIIEGSLLPVVFSLNSSTFKRQFFALDSVPEGTFSVSISHDDPESVRIEDSALYDSEGKKLKSWGSTATERNWINSIENGRFYFYFEYSGVIDLIFTVEPIEVIAGFFLSQSGTGSGNTSDSPSSWTALQTKLGNLPLGIDYLTVFVMEDINVTESLNITSNASVLLTSYGDNAKTIFFSGTQGPLISVSGAYVSISNIILSGISGNILNSSPIQLNSDQESYAYLSLASGTKIQNFQVAGNGGTINLTDSTLLYIDGAEITGNSATMGGAIYAGSNSNIYWFQGLINGNSATETGGGIYLESGAFLWDSDAHVLVSPVIGISTNTANSQDSNIIYEVDPMGTGNVLFTGFETSLTARVFMSISDYTGETLLGLGIASLDSGSALVTPLTPDGTGEFKIIAGEVYNISAFIDIGNVYSDVLEMNAQTNLKEIIPHFGDFATNSANGGMILQVAVQGDNALTLSPTDMYPSTTAVYFVSDMGTGNGSRSSTPMTLLDALIEIESQIAVPRPDMHLVFLTENVMYSEGQGAVPPVTESVIIESFRETPYSITLGSFYNSSPFKIMNGGIVTLENLIVDGNSQQSFYFPAFSVEENGYLGLEATSIRNVLNTGGSGGGAIRVDGGILTMNASRIENCSALDGGAVYMTGSASFSSSFGFGQGSLITNNTATTGKGGGIAVSGTLLDSGAIAIAGANPVLDANISNTGTSPTTDAGLFVDSYNGGVHDTSQ